MGYKVEREGDKLKITDYQLVTNVRIEGLKEKLKNAEKVIKFLLLKKPLRKESLESAKELLLLQIHSLGYSKPKVSYTVEKLKCGYEVTFKIKSLTMRRIEKVELLLKGDKSLKPFIEKALRKLIKKEAEYPKLNEVKEEIIRFLIEKGYYNASVKFKLVPSEEGKSLTLKVVVETGKKYLVKISGNRHFPEKEILKLITFKKAEAVDPFEIENSVKNIENFYKNRGFPFVSVRVKEKSQGNLEVIEFIINEGPYVIVRKIEVNCEEFRNFKPLNKLIGKPFSQEKIRLIKQKITSTLKSKGYLSAKVSYTVSKDGVLRILIEKGPKYLLSDIEVEGDRLKCFKRPELPKTFSRELIENILSNISDCYASRGFPDVKVNYKLEKKERNSRVLIKAIITVNPGRQHRFGYILIRGLKRTKLKFIKNLIILKPSEVYSREKVARQYSTLANSKLFSRIEMSEYKYRNAISEVIEVTEGSLLHLNGFLGYGTDYGMVLNGFLSSTSPLGYGIKFLSFGKYRQKEGYDAVFKLIKPQFPFRRWNTVYSIVKKEQIYESFKADRVIYNFELQRRKSKSYSQSFRFEVSRDNIRNTSIGGKKSFLKRSLFYLQTYDRRDNVSNPKKGFLSKFKFQISGLFLGGNTDYLKGEEKFLYLIPIRKEVIAVRLNGGVIKTLRNKPVPLQDKFFLGGAESIRGYKYGTVSPRDDKGNYIGGKAYGLFSLELRFPLRGNLEGALFYDSGRAFRKLSDFKLSNWYSSIGFGLRYITPVGPLRFDYGYKLKKVPGQGRGRIHISFGFPF